MGSLEARVAEFARRVSTMKEAGHYYYESVLVPATGAWVEVGGRRLLDLSSYDYLALHGHPVISKAASEAIAAWGTGTAGVRLISGTLGIHKALEAKIARFYGTEDALVFSSGYLCNLAVITALVKSGDAIIGDRLIHASLIDGAILSGAEFHRFNHNDLQSLRSLLERSATANTRLVVVDSVFSMDGDVADFPGVAQLCAKHGAHLVVDEAHALGVLGPSGKGISDEFPAAPSPDLYLGALSKAIPSTGGYVAGQSSLIDYLRHTTRPFTFSAALSPPCTLAASAALDVLSSEPERRTMLRANVDFFRGLLADAGFDVGRTGTPIIPIVTRDEMTTLRVAELCRQADLFVVPIIPPAVAPTASRIRLIVTARHTHDDLRLAALSLTHASREVGLLV